jgi:DNA mismatch repair ATPase MutL
MVCYRLYDPRVNTEIIPITSRGTKRSAGVQRVYLRSSIQGHAEVWRSSHEVNSADATEGAIMFNDSLSIEQCQRLMAQLAETAFPFQCAHGRSVPELDR